MPNPAVLTPAPGRPAPPAGELLAVAVRGRGAVPPNEPLLFADDEGLLRGRAAFETLRVYQGRSFYVDRHLARLAASAQRLGIAAFDADEVRELVAAALSEAAAFDAALRILVTAGREGAARPSIVVLVRGLRRDLEARRARGASLISHLGGNSRRPPRPRAAASRRCEASYAVNIAAKREAQRRGADDALFLTNDDVVLEGPVWNVWWRTGDVLFTPGRELGILAGITREILIVEAGALGLEVREGRYLIREASEADEMFTSSSVGEVMPVIELDGRPIGTVAPSETAAELQRRLLALALDAGGGSGRQLGAA